MFYTAYVRYVDHDSWIQGELKIRGYSMGSAQMPGSVQSWEGLDKK